MKSTPKRVVSLLFLLLLSAVMMTGCISADIAVVGGEVTAAPSSGKLRLLLKQPMTRCLSTFFLRRILRWRK